MKYTIHLILAIVVGCGSAQILESNKPAELKTLDGYDFEPIARAIQDKRIIALGESSHGIGDYYSFKSELVEYLHREHGFEVLAFEAGFGDLNLAWNDVDIQSSDELLKNTLFGNFQCKEIEGLFSHIKEKSKSEHPLIYAGFDNQTSSSYFYDKVRPILEEYDADFASDLDYLSHAYRRSYQAGLKQDSISYELERQSYIGMANRIQQIFDDNIEDVEAHWELSRFELEVIQRTTAGFIKMMNLPYAERYRFIGLRDAIMFDNFQWLMSEIYPDKKVIIWAHNGHVERANNHPNSFKWMGHFLAEAYGDNYYALGLFSKEGQYYRQWGDTTITFNHVNTSMLESRMSGSGMNITFINLADNGAEWVNDTVSAFEPENGGSVSFVPRDRFDGLVVFDKVKAPTY